MENKIVELTLHEVASILAALEKREKELQKHAGTENGDFWMQHLQTAKKKLLQK